MLTTVVSTCHSQEVIAYLITTYFWPDRKPNLAPKSPNKICNLRLQQEQHIHGYFQGCTWWSLCNAPGRYLHLRYHIVYSRSIAQPRSKLCPAYKPGPPPLVSADHPTPSLSTANHRPRCQPQIIGLSNPLSALLDSTDGKYAVYDSVHYSR